MPERSDVVEDVEFVARSTNRVRILETLSERQGATRQELREELSASRTTVSRNLDVLRERGWVRRTDREYALTPGTGAVVDRFLDLESTVATVDRLRPFLAHVDRNAFDVDLSHLEDADVVTGDSGDPLAMVNAHVSAIKRSTDVLAAVPVLGLHATEAVHDAVVDGDARVELVAAPAAADTFQKSPEYRQFANALQEHEDFQLRPATADIPFYVGVLDDTLQVGVDEDGEPRALLETTEPSVREWGRAKIDSLR
jgi:predicted transcriptional regulator